MMSPQEFDLLRNIYIRQMDEINAHWQKAERETYQWFVDAMASHGVSVSEGERFDDIAARVAAKFNDQPKNDVVKIVRYLRPLEDNGEVSSNFGIALAIEIDYAHSEVRWGWSICNGDTFCKKTGRTVALRRLKANPRRFNTTHISRYGVVNDIILNEFGVNTVDDQDYQFYVLYENLLGHRA